MKTLKVVKQLAEILGHVVAYIIFLSLIGSILVGAVKLFIWILSL